MPATNIAHAAEKAELVRRQVKLLQIDTTAEEPPFDNNKHRRRILSAAWPRMQCVVEIGRCSPVQCKGKWQGPCGIGVISYIFGNLIKDEKIMETLDKQYGFSYTDFYKFTSEKMFSGLLL